MGFWPLIRHCAVCSRRLSCANFLYRRSDAQYPTWHRRCIGCYKRRLKESAKRTTSEGVEYRTLESLVETQAPESSPVRISDDADA